MLLPFLFIKLILVLRNPFSSKKYQARLINRAVLIYRSNPEIVIYDYYNYVLGLLDDHLKAFKKSKVIFFECPGLKLLKILFPFAAIYLQIEHTLLRPPSKESSTGLQGHLPVPGTNEHYLIRIAELDKLRSADIVFDYSRINVFNIQSLATLCDYMQKTFCISPALYPLCTTSKDRQGVITLFGNPDISRRRLFLEDLKSHAIASDNIRGVYFGVDEIYRKAKIVINIRQTDSHETLEELRVLPALRSGAIVICENAPYVEKTAYSQFVIWGSMEEIPKLIMEVEKNYEAVHSRIFGDGSEHSRFAKRMKRIEQCNALAVQKAIKRLSN